MIEKLSMLKDTGNYRFYYDCHARFLFVSNSIQEISRIRDRLFSSGLPENRLIRLPDDKGETALLQ
jgi:hypothetical protein